MQVQEQQIWVGYYRLVYTVKPNTSYFGHLFGFATNREDFQHKIEAYKIAHKCTLVSQLIPLPANLWFQRHGVVAAVWNQSQHIDVNELHFTLVQEETEQSTSYLVEESVTIAPFIGRPEIPVGIYSYLPEKLASLAFFQHLTEEHNPKEGLCYPNPAYIPDPNDYRYYAIIDGVKAFTLPNLSAHEGETDSLYKGELKERMDTNAPYLTQLTVTDYHTSPFVQLLFTQAEQEWFGAWDKNPAIFIRSYQDFEAIAYHFRKFTVFYNDKKEKWYFFRFYDPLVLVEYLRYIANNPAKLASFFGYRNGGCLIDSFAARIGNRFHIFSLTNLPDGTQPSAVGFDQDLEDFLHNYDKKRLAEKLSATLFSQDLANDKIISKEIVMKWLDQAIALGITNEGALELFVRAVNYLQTSSTTIENLIALTQKEYGKLSEVELTKVLHSKAKALANKEH